MPREQTETADPRATGKNKKQLAVILVLLAGLLIAVCTQPSSESEESVITATPVVSLRPIDSKSPQDVSELSDQITSVRELSRLPIDRVLQTGLFYLPEPERELEQEAVEEEPVPEVKVQAIYGGGKLSKNSKAKGHRVLIGREIIQAGEILPDGRQIIRVTPEGVELAQ